MKAKHGRARQKQCQGTICNLAGSLTGGPARRHRELLQFAFDRPERND